MYNENTNATIANSDISNDTNVVGSGMHNNGGTITISGSTFVVVGENSKNGEKLFC